VNSPSPAARRASLRIEHLEDRCVLSDASYVAGMYTDVLHRTASPADVASWVQVLAAGANPREVALGFVTSPEYRIDLVRAYYQRFLRRPADGPTLAVWVADLQAGLSPEQFAANLISSDEYFVLHGGNNGAWLQGVFQDVLGRPIGTLGALYWGQALNSSSRLAVAYAIVRSPEGLSQIVNTAYLVLLKRPADPVGLGVWVNQMGQGLASDRLLADIARSPEYIALRGGLDVFNTSPNDALATTPSPLAGVGVPYWDEREQDNENLAAMGPAPILFLGDSITEGYAIGAGEPLWDSLLAPQGAVNFAVGGITTSQVLWQVQSGQIAAVAPNVVVLMIGTNNLSAGQSPWAVAEGIAEIVDAIQEQSPQTKVLLLGVLPRGFSAADPYRAAVAQVNAAVALLADGQRVKFLDAGPNLLQPNGSLSPLVMPDALHPSYLGYQIITSLIWQPLFTLATSV
jgi:lysophospholipase L1-like esterase